MDFSSLQEHVCMESSDHWLQGTIQEESGIMDSSSSSPPLMDRRVRPSPQDQALKCPRCESTHTKFCYYNNYSLSQPRYFCKTCRRYWTKGGTLRNIPVGGGCRKNKKASSKKSNDVVQTQPELKDLHLTASSNFPDHALQFSHPMGLMAENSRPIEFMETKFGVGINNVMGNVGDVGINADHTNNYGYNNGFLAPNFQGFGGNMSYFDGFNGSGGTYNTIDSSFRLNEDQNIVGAIHDVKPNPKLLSLEWQDHHACFDAGKEPLGYINALGSWTAGMINGYGSSTTNPLL